MYYLPKKQRFNPPMTETQRKRNEERKWMKLKKLKKE
jgi:hypothetical protein